MKLLVVYDDTGIKSEIITDIIGNRGFADVVVKRKKLKDHFLESILSEYPQTDMFLVNSNYEFEDVMSKFSAKVGDNYKVLHFFSRYVISDREKFMLTLQKLKFIDKNYILLANSKPVGILSPNIEAYDNFIRLFIKSEYQSVIDATKRVSNSINIEGVLDIGEIQNFIQCITGNFDARYFNSLKGDEYTIVKSSTNKKKIKAEYTFYHLLPEDMQMWFVEPFNYTETETSASYTMERLHMTDLAIKWVHGSITEQEFEVILDKYFYFFNHRHKRSITKDEYDIISNSLYVEKVVQRIESLKKMSKFKAMEKLLSLNGNDIDTIIEWYLELKYKIERKNTFQHVSVIGHGDPCFANTMYNKSTKTLKFIDPKGALVEEELWTNPYYDIVKLSHSICGRYDFFNNALFEIVVNDKLETELNIEFDNEKYIKIFQKKAQSNGYNYEIIRLYEASLFLSMLPLHIDNPQKVYGFILNACNILKEVEKYV